MNQVKSNVLVAYSDNYGYVCQIADNMTRKLRESGLTVDIVNLERTKENLWPPINNYIGLILISSGNAYQFWNKKAI